MDPKLALWIADMNNTHQIIEGFAELIVLNARSESPDIEKIVRYAGIISQSTQRAHELVQELPSMLT